MDIIGTCILIEVVKEEREIDHGVQQCKLYSLEGGTETFSAINNCQSDFIDLLSKLLIKK